jgi:tryptophan 2,3-dioxygenase
VELLAGLIKHEMFPELWRVRTELTELAKESD